MRTLWLTLLPLVVLLVAGCQAFPIGSQKDMLPHHGRVKLTRDEAKSIPKLLSYYKSLDGLSEDKLRNRLAQLRGGLEKAACSTQRLKSAIILAQLQSYESASGVKAVLGPCLNDTLIRRSAEGKLALLLRDLIATRRAANGAQAEIKHYRDKLKALQVENQKLHNRVVKLHEKLEKLHKQLEGLRAIEKSIQQRNQS